jgi:hypothetical protein
VYAKYGNYQHAANEISLRVERNPIRGDNGVVRATRVVINMSGRYQQDTQAAITSGLSTLEDAYIDGQGDFGLYLDDGTPTAHAISAASTGGGIRVLKAVSYPDGRGAEYSTWRTFEVALEADVLENVGILAFSETLSFKGGGPQFIYLEPLNGAPQMQLVKQATTYKATQSGQALGYFGWVDAPAPIFPDALHQDQSSVSLASPHRTGPLGQPFYSLYQTTWNYVFESASPLGGVPTVQPEV